MGKRHDTRLLVLFFCAFFFFAFGNRITQKELAGWNRDNEDISQCSGESTTTFAPASTGVGDKTCVDYEPLSYEFACSSSRTELYRLESFFIDPTPSQSTATAVSFEIFGAFNCGEPEIVTASIDTDFDGLAFLQSQYTTFKVQPDIGDCSAPYCTTKGFVVKFAELTDYTQNGSNLFSLVAGVPFCVSRIIATVSWTFKEPTVTNIVPNLGPIGGGTMMLVKADNVLPGLQYFCIFDGIQVIASESDLGIGYFTCTSPPSNKVGRISFSVADSRFAECYYESPFSFFEYYDAHPLKLEPEKGDVSGGSDITISGENFLISSAVVFCRFYTDITSAVMVSGTILDNNVHCAAPTWEIAAIVDVQISFNGGVQFSAEVLQYEYVDAQLSSGLSGGLWVLIGLGSGGTVIIIVLVALGIHRKRHNDGYKRLQEGSFQEISIKDVKLLECIGKGTFGEVYRAQWRGAIIALKKLPLLKLKDGTLADFQKEIGMMKALRHPNVIQYLGGCLTPPNIFIALEYMSRGSLHTILHNDEITLTWGVIIHTLAEAGRGMVYLHSLNPPIIHRDLKSHNLLVDEAWRVKVCDFGLSTHLDTVGTMTACGTPCWTAPEVIRHSRYTERADVYSYGIVMWECVSREDPYLNMPHMRVLTEVVQGMRPSLPLFTPASYKDLAQKCWDDDPSKRPSFEEIIQRLEEIELNGFSSVADVLNARGAIVPSLSSPIPEHRKHKSKNTNQAQLIGSPAQLKSVTISFAKPGPHFAASYDQTEHNKMNKHMLKQPVYGTFIPPLSTLGNSTSVLSSKEINFQESTDDKEKEKEKENSNENAKHDLSFATSVFANAIARQQSVEPSSTFNTCTTYENDNAAMYKDFICVTTQEFDETKQMQKISNSDVEKGTFNENFFDVNEQSFSHINPQNENSYISNLQTKYAINNDTNSSTSAF